jgi:hypothetical protein
VAQFEISKRLSRWLWQDRTMPKKDFFQTARIIVEKAIGENLDGSPLKSAPEPMESSAAGRGRRGGLKGGKSRAKVLSPERRREIAKQAASKRWKKDE